MIAIKAFDYTSLPRRLPGSSQGLSFTALIKAGLRPADYSKIKFIEKIEPG